jgi:hypothetical protein
LDLILDILEIAMEGTAQTEQDLSQFEQDEAARDAATDQALADLKAEVQAKEAQGVDMTAINQRIQTLDATVKGKTADAKAADPGAQAQAPAAPNKPEYTFDATAQGATEDPRFTPSGFQISGQGAKLFYSSEDPEGSTSATNPNPAPGYTEYTGSVEAVPAS